MPDLAEASSTGSRASVPGSDVGAAAGRSGRANLRVLFAIVAVALALKLAVFGLSYGTSLSLSIPNAENWQDFSLAYLPAVQAFKGGLLPYADFFYPYPPLFLWALTAFAPFPYPSWFTAFPLVGADALTVIPVYLMARELASERLSRLVSMLFIFAPTNLYYVDYLFLNPPLTTLFLMTSVYLVIRGRLGWSALTLALSIGFKQTALFALPVILLVVWKRDGQKSEPLKYLLVVAGVCLAFSLPYLLANPILYIDSMFRLPLNTFAPTNLPQGYYSVGAGSGTQVIFDTSNWLTSKWMLLSNGVYSPVTLALPLFIFLVPSTLAELYSSSFGLYAMTSVLIVGYALVLLTAWRRPRFDAEDTLRYVLYSMLTVFTFYPFYKYYIVGIIPLLILLVRDRRDAAGFLGFSLVLMLVPRYFASWVLMVSLIWLLRDGLRLPSWGVKSSRQLHYRVAERLTHFREKKSGVHKLHRPKAGV